MRTEKLIFSPIIQIQFFLLTAKSQYWSHNMKNLIFCSCVILFFVFFFFFFRTKPPWASIVDDKSGTNMYDEPT